MSQGGGPQGPSYQESERERRIRALENDVLRERANVRNLTKDLEDATLLCTVLLDVIRRLREEGS